MSRRLPLVALVALAAACGGEAVRPPKATAGHAAAAWIARSDANAKLLVDVTARFVPENASGFGAEGHDDQVLDWRPDHDARLRDAMSKAKAELERRLAGEKDPNVVLDLKVLVAAADREIRSIGVHQAHEIPFLDVAEVVFGGMHTLLDERVSPERRKLAVTRLARYAGEDGTPLTELARAETTAALARPGLQAPARIAVEKAIQKTDVLTDGIEEMFKEQHVTGYEAPLARYRAQIAAYRSWLKDELLPRSRADFRLDPEVYRMRLEEVGVDLAPEAIAALGHQGFDAILKELPAVAAKVAAARGLPSSEWHDVLKALKQEQLVGAAILPAYEKTLKELEAILVREHLVTLPKRAAKIRLATEAEGAASPSPHLDPPRLIGNTGEQAEFVLPLTVPPTPGATATKLDDFTYAAAAWTLTAHEARPGHELQFASMIEAGVSNARAIFAFNSANVEGWGLYAEALAYPYMPPEGQLVSLVLRLERAARAFLDPELHLGKITPEAARAFLEKEVGLSPAFAGSEVERYTFKMPAQATAYYYGYTKLVALRDETALRLGPRFNLQRFDDFVVSEGLLPPALLREAATETLR